MSEPAPRASGSGRAPTHHGGLLAAGTLLGMGLGGFVDGIVLHQILQWHSALSAVMPPTDLVAMKVNLVWDGIFYALMWLLTVAGVTMLWWAGRRREIPWSTTMFVGALSLGWGLFLLVEGVMNHHVLGLHHVRAGAHQLGWDLKFLLFGAGLAAVGAALIRLGQREPGVRVGRLGEREGDEDLEDPDGQTS